MVQPSLKRSQLPLRELELGRRESVIRMVPEKGVRALDIGCRDGRFSSHLVGRFQEVIAVDVVPVPDIPGATVMTVDARDMPMFPDRHFDFVLCAEVLEHVPKVEKATAEISRVCSGSILIAVPYRQDLRVGRLTCGNCGRVNPAWGHINRFDDDDLRRLFPDFKPAETEYLGVAERTNWLSAKLMDWAGNPWASYTQREPCLYCNQFFTPPPAGPRPFHKRVCSAIATRLTKLQDAISSPGALWILTRLQRFRA